MARLAQLPENSFFELVVDENPGICRWNFHSICHSFRDIVGHIATSGYRSLSQSLGNTFIELAMIDNPGTAIGISMLCHNAGDIQGRPKKWATLFYGL